MSRASLPPVVLDDITQGRRLWRRQAYGISVQLADYPARCEMPRHSHRSGNVTVILAGSFEEEVDGRRYSCVPLGVVIKPAGTVHATRTGPATTRSLIVEVDAELEDEWRRRVGLFDACRWYHAPCGLAPCVLGMCRELRLGGNATEGAVQRWFSRLGAAAAAALPVASGAGPGLHVGRALEIMKREREVSTGDLAARLGLHPVYLARLFRERLGCSPRQLRQALRLGAALDTLVCTGHPLAQVALGAGFADQSHLARQVRRLAGVPAGVLRRLGSAGGDGPAKARSRFRSFKTAGRALTQ